MIYSKSYLDKYKLQRLRKHRGKAGCIQGAQRKKAALVFFFNSAGFLSNQPACLEAAGELIRLVRDGGRQWKPFLCCQTEEANIFNYALVGELSIR